MSSLSVENILYLNFAFLNTYATPREVVFSISSMTDKILPDYP